MQYNPFSTVGIGCRIVVERERERERGGADQCSVLTLVAKESGRVKKGRQI